MLPLCKIIYACSSIRILRINLGLDIPKNLMRSIRARHEVKDFLKGGYPHPRIN